MRKTGIALSCLGVILGTLVSGCKEIVLPQGCRLSDVGISLPHVRTTPESSSKQPLVPSDTLQEIVIDPTSLQKLLFEGNTSVLTSINRIHQSKEQVNIARGNLFPSINLGSIISMSGGGFSLSSIEFLLPFLLPSKWFDYYQVKGLLDADVIALQILKANQYASALSLYETILGDHQIAEVLQLEVQDLTEIETFAEKAYQVGVGSSDDLNMTRGQAGLVRVNFSKVKTLLAAEKAALRHALGIEIDKTLSLAAAEIPASEWEDRDLNVAIEEAKARSLETKQIQFLQTAAKNAVWSKVFGFISGSSFRASMGAPGSSVFSNLSLNDSVGIGFAYFPSIRLSQLNEGAIQIRQTEVNLEIAEILEKILITIDETNKRVEMAEQSRSAYYEAYLDRLQQYKLGLAALVPALQARVLYRTATLEAISSRVQLMLNRITLHRALLTDSFSSIQGCSINNEILSRLEKRF